VTERELIELYFQAMRTGAIASDEIVDLFADPAVYVEPFSEASATSAKTRFVKASSILKRTRRQT